MASLDKVLREVGNRRRSSQPLREQLMWRVQELAPLGDMRNDRIRGAFREVFAAFEPPGISLHPEPELCLIDPDDGGSIVVGGSLIAGEYDLGLMQRRLMLEERYVIHEALFLRNAFRGLGVGAVLLKRCFSFYDELDFETVILQADKTGRWHWARVGFEFVLDKDREAVRTWFIRALKALGLTGLRVESYVSAAQFARMGGARKVSLGQLAQALPAAERPRIERVAAENSLQQTDEIALARALMLCGPRWYGRLELRGPGRVAFEAYARSKALKLK